MRKLKYLSGQILQLLPKKYFSFILQICDVDNSLTCLLGISINNKNVALEWKKKFERLSYKESGTFLENTQKLVFKISIS